MKGFFTIVAFLYCLLAQGAVRYVDIAATGANNGTSWLNASRNLQAMIDLSVAGDEIYVAAGTYLPAAGTSFRLKEGVKLYGGFPHGGNPDFTDRNWMTFQTILRGDGVRRLFENPMFMNEQTVLDGFHMTGGSSEQGGILYIYDSDIRIENCRFFDNNNTINQGGTLFLNACSPVIQNCIFENNNSVAQGGVIVSFFSSPQISNCVFRNNRSTSNGGIINFLTAGTPVVDRCLFLNNTSRGGLLGHSGGTPFLYNCVFANNTGGEYCILSASSGAGSAAITLAGCLIYNNTANNVSGGGLVYNAGGNVTIVNSTICNNNVSTSPVGSLFANVTTTSVFSIVNSIVYNNVAANLIRAVNSGPPVFRYSIVQGMNDPANLVSGADPLFVNPANAIGPDNVWATADDGLELQPGSPAIDQGLNASIPTSLTNDIKAGARILNGTVDRGAYEYVVAERPVVTTTPGTTTYTVQQPPVKVDAGVTVTHTGSPTLATGTVAIGAGFAAGDVLSFTNAAGMGNITGSYNAATGQLTLVSAGGTATIAQWQAALRAITYNNTNASPSLANRTVTFTVNDGRLSSNTAAKTVVLQVACEPTTSTTNAAVCRAALPYAWNGQTFSAGGSYVVHLTNAAGCDSAATLVLTVNEATTSLTRLTVCPTELPFQWNGRDFAGAGTYTVNLRNSNGCDSAATLVLTVAGGDRCLALRVAATPSGCKEASGTITATASGGTAPYQYSIDGTNYQAGNVFTGLASRSYQVSLKDADGTVVTVPIEVTADLCLDLVSTPAGCGTTDGVVTATGTGGAAPYQYSIDGVNYQAGNVFTGLAAKSYQVSMKDADGLVVTVPITVSSDLCLNLVATPAGCGKADGVITATGTGGKGPYQFSIDGVNYQAGNVFTGLAAQSYRISMKDADGLVVTVPITVNTDLCLNLVATPASCGQTDGVITATGSGGAAPYQYSMDGVNFQASNVFTGLAARSYSITLRDAAGKLITVPITVISGPCLALDATPASCDKTDGMITATGSGGTAPYQFSIDGANFQAGNVFTGLAAQSYTVTIKDANALTATVSIVVAASRCILLQATPTATTCGQNNGTITASAANGQPPYLFALNGGTYQSDNIFSGLAPGDYKVLAKDADGLVAEISVNIGASAAAGRVFAGNNTSILKNQPLQLNATDVDNTGFNRFDWSPAYGLNRTDIANPIATIDKDVTYTVTATDPNGCKSTAQVSIKVIHNADIYVPNAFTPNNDGRNDVLRALPFGIREFKFFAVYNRWGHRVFYTTDPRYGWDGSVNGSQQNSGAFVWVTEGIGMDGSTISRKGSVVLIR